MAVGQLEMLSPGAFQSMAAGLAIAEFGPGIQVMGWQDEFLRAQVREMITWHED